MVKKSNNFFIIIIIILCIIIFYLLYNQYSSRPITRYESRNPALEENPQPNLNVQLVQDNKDTVRNPYAPPIRYYEETDYKQLGYLTNKTNNRKVVLFGKPAHYRRDKWYYYTMIDNIKYPVEINNRKCSVQPGCDSVSTKDIVQVDGENYIVTMYDFNI